MKVLDLRCGNAHVFEGWFGSEADFQDQLARKLVSCPVCADEHITKVLTAARLNLSGEREPSRDKASEVAADSTSDSRAVVPLQSAPSPQLPAELQSQLMQIVKHVMDNTEDVGNQFADEARRIHYGESDGRSIRGQATRDEALELIDEGIDVMSLNLPDHFKGTLQ